MKGRKLNEVNVISFWDYNKHYYVNEFLDKVYGRKYGKVMVDQVYLTLEPNHRYSGVARIFAWEG